ncbi:TPA: hypothetical protein GRI96_01405 [Vibrio parahaemolyticus]|uniref:hypothetical protein n=1 Tax=Vibrio parahaemolyticus TaxID=670 RepID=UPI00064A305C|nr:hypothetical protein [Vibrio parahaemolyticus]EGR1983156.1 hypothetical protein [Vibrio parahaemolyticus]EII3441802.1 hypothetical protein [Vibrio parahaemolyticus]ELA7838804.1 hypothetical protein [Vibrio parahaemolyticus]OXD38775.1 hypothetical protein CA164_00890 [Vibrio parahaemolyticus]HAS6809275.1 hypothetical protein [Vibrio parahaemolyticus]
MLIEVINISFDEIDLRQDQDRRRSLEAIFNMHGERQHLVISDKRTLDTLLEIGSIFFGMTTMSYIRDARDMIRETTSLKNSLGIYLQVDFSDRFQPRHATLGNSDVICVGYNYFNNPSNISSTLLIGEHLNDAKLYHVIGKHYAKNSVSASLNVSFNLIHGGGSTTKTIFDNYKNQNRITYCILDTDKKFPNDTEKNTSTNFSHNDRRLNRCASSMVINAHEIESIIPLQMLLDMMEDPTSTYGDDTITKARSLEVYDKTEFRRFFDHKNGIFLKDAIEYDFNNNCDYWLDFFAIRNDVINKDCFINKECSNCNSCPSISGLGDGILSNIATFTERNTTRKYKYNMESFILEEWEKIGKKLLGWGCTSATRIARSS